MERKTGGRLKADLGELFRAEGNALKESHQKLFKGAPKICDSCAESIAYTFEVNDFEKQTSIGRINSEEVLAVSRINVKEHGFVIPRIAEMKERTLSIRGVHHAENSMYICGYHLSPGVYFMKRGQNAYLIAYTELHKGMIDHIHQWPLKGTVRLTIKDRTREKECSKENVLEDYLKNYAEPMERVMKEYI